MVYHSNRETVLKMFSHYKKQCKGAGKQGDSKNRNNGKNETITKSKQCFYTGMLFLLKCQFLFSLMFKEKAPKANDETL